MSREERDSPSSAAWRRALSFLLDFFCVVEKFPSVESPRARDGR